MSNVFYEALDMLNDARQRHHGVRAFLAESEQYRVLLAEPAAGDTPGHWGVVLEGELELARGGERRVYGRGERFFTARRPTPAWKNLCRLF